MLRVNCIHCGCDPSSSRRTPSTSDDVKPPRLWTSGAREEGAASRKRASPRETLGKKRKISTREANGDALRAARLVAPPLTSRDIHDEVRAGDGVRRREEDERRFGRDDDEAEAKYSTLTTFTTKCVSCVARSEEPTSCRRLGHTRRSGRDRHGVADIRMIPFNNHKTRHGRCCCPFLLSSIPMCS